MSKSKGNVLYADTLADFFGVDAVRYFVLHEMPFENDGVITWELMVERMNSDLANILGNLVNRTISMSNKYFGGEVADKGAAEEVDAGLEKLRVADAITEIFGIFRRSNKYIDETTPWALAKDEAKRDRLATVLYNLTEAIVIGASLLHSFMPETSEKILRQLNTQKRPLDRMEQFGLYPSGSHVTEKPEILFARMDIKEVLEKVEKIQADGAEKSQGQKDGGAAAAHASGNSSQDGASGSGSARDGMAGSGSSQDGTTGGSGQDDTSGHVIDLEAKPEITYDDFAKLQFQVGEIIACEAVPKA